MNSKRAEKLNRQLQTAEDSLRAKLLQVLPDAVESGANYFANSEFNPHDLLPTHMIADTEEFLQLAKESFSLREQLSLPTEDTVGEFYLSACAEAADLHNEHRRGPRRLAAWVAQELLTV
jgi:hypothetical protein